MEKYEDITVDCGALNSVDVDNWLGAIELRQYASIFTTNFSCDENGRLISLKRMKSLQLRDFPHMNITNLEHQRKILDHIHLTCNFLNLNQTSNNCSHNDALPAYTTGNDKYSRRSISSSLSSMDEDCNSDSNHSSSCSGRQNSKVIEGSICKIKNRSPSVHEIATIPERRQSSLSRRNFERKAWESINKLRHECPLDAIDKLRCGFAESQPCQYDKDPCPMEYSEKSATPSTHSISTYNNSQSHYIISNAKSPESTSSSKITPYNLKKAQIYGNLACEFDIIQRGMLAIQKDYLNGLKEVVRCEVANILFVNEKTDELSLYANNRWFRVPMASSIAGTCASSEMTLNIPDAYADYRFNRNVDKMTGFKTRNILCQPIRTKHGSGPIIGVLQMLNKSDMTDFDEQDEEVLSICVQRIADDLGTRFKSLLTAAGAFNGIGELINSNSSSKIKKYDTTTTIAFERKKMVVMDEFDRSISKLRRSISSRRTSTESTNSTSSPTSNMTVESSNMSSTSNPHPSPLKIQLQLQLPVLNLRSESSDVTLPTFSSFSPSPSSSPSKSTSTTNINKSKRSRVLSISSTSSSTPHVNDDVKNELKIEMFKLPTVSTRYM